MIFERSEPKEERRVLLTKAGEAFVTYPDGTRRQLPVDPIVVYLLTLTTPFPKVDATIDALEAFAGPRRSRFR